MTKSYEEIRQAIIDLMACRERVDVNISQISELHVAVARLLARRNNQNEYTHRLNESELDFCDEIFWDFFRKGIVTPGLNRSNPSLPFFRVSSFGKKFLEQQDTYFFYNVSSYEESIRKEIPEINETTIIYLKEAMQSFLAGCHLSSSVMLGVAAEDVIEILFETIERTSKKEEYKKIHTERGILRRINKFKNIFEEKDLPSISSEIKENFDTNFSGILAIIRNFRNESGHPSGKVISREQNYVLLHLFSSYCRKVYDVKKYFENFI